MNAKDLLVTKKLRTLKKFSPSRLSRAEVQKVMKAIHVYPGPTVGVWEVKQIGMRGVHRTFSSKKSAVDFARSVAATPAHVMVHGKRARLTVGAPDRNTVFQVLTDR